MEGSLNQYTIRVSIFLLFILVVTIFDSVLLRKGDAVGFSRANLGQVYEAATLVKERA